MGDPVLVNRLISYADYCHRLHFLAWFARGERQTLARELQRTLYDKLYLFRDKGSRCTVRTMAIDWLANLATCTPINYATIKYDYRWENRARAWREHVADIGSIATWGEISVLLDLFDGERHHLVDGSYQAVTGALMEAGYNEKRTEYSVSDELHKLYNILWTALERSIVIIFLVLFFIHSDDVPRWLKRLSFFTSLFYSVVRFVLYVSTKPDGKYITRDNFVANFFTKIGYHIDESRSKMRTVVVNIKPPKGDILNPNDWWLNNPRPLNNHDAPRSQQC